jgi:hypothetical protein
MSAYYLSEEEVSYLNDNHPDLNYDREVNKITGTIRFDLKYQHVDEPAIQDSYEIEIDLNLMDSGLPIVKETAKKVLGIAVKKGLHYHELHQNNSSGEMCIIIPPKIKERYPNGFELKEFLHHLEEHLYWISFYEKYNKKPWKEHGHGEKGYVELYTEDKVTYADDVKKYFGNLPRQQFRKKIRELQKKHKI